jgi:hypothetical protein
MNRTGINSALEICSRKNTLNASSKVRAVARRRALCLDSKIRPDAIHELQQIAARLLVLEASVPRCHQDDGTATGYWTKSKCLELSICRRDVFADVVRPVQIRSLSKLTEASRVEARQISAESLVLTVGCHALEAGAVGVQEQTDFKRTCAIFPPPVFTGENNREVGWEHC